MYIFKKINKIYPFCCNSDKFKELNNKIDILNNKINNDNIINNNHIKELNDKIDNLENNNKKFKELYNNIDIFKQKLINNKQLYYYQNNYIFLNQIFQKYYNPDEITINYLYTIYEETDN